MQRVWHAHRTWVVSEPSWRQTLHDSSSDALASTALSVGEKATSKTLAWCPAPQLKNVSLQQQRVLAASHLQ